MGFASRAAVPGVEGDGKTLKASTGIEPLGTPGPVIAPLSGRGKSCTMQ